MYKVLAEITFFLIFVILLMIVCYGNRGHTRYLLTDSMEDAFKNFKGKNVSSFWTWMRGKLFQLCMTPDASVCQVTDEMPRNAMFSRCIPSYSSKNEYKTPYNLPEWIPVTNTSHNQSVFELERMCPKPWRYKSSRDLQTLSYEGFYSTYDGGGFVADLGYNIKSALKVLNTLQEHNWIDEFSVAVFIEFTIFNPSSSLFSVAKCLYERSPTGGVFFFKKC
ncbi:hypothetical protein OS493_012636 [Desmophyllum pertusum]|uniref:Polycystin domain-containing protein n=1 Tax=Desmophyllum pertusum TaxID=174260 RepID=A0A9W9ZF76_9CNID|nr:hypothetical protein OS493_012636 [Desmophyllum pertusum]